MILRQESVHHYLFRKEISKVFDVFKPETYLKEQGFV